MPSWLAIYGHPALAFHLPWRPDRIFWAEHSKCCAGKEGSETTQNKQRSRLFAAIGIFRFWRLKATLIIDVGRYSPAQARPMRLGGKERSRDNHRVSNNVW